MKDENSHIVGAWRTGREFADAGEARFEQRLGSKVVIPADM